MRTNRHSDDGFPLEGEEGATHPVYSCRRCERTITHDDISNWSGAALFNWGVTQVEPVCQEEEEK